jgi:hypothetical protein
METKPPATIKVCGIMNLVFGGLGICGSIPTLMMITNPKVMEFGTGVPNPALVAMEKVPFYGMFMKGAVIVGIPVTILLIMAGVGLIKERPWARKATIGWAIWTTVLAVVTLYVNVQYLFPAMMEQTTVVGTQVPAAAQQAGKIGGIVGGVVGGLFSMAYPIAALIMLTRPSVVGYLNQRR